MSADADAKPANLRACHVHSVFQMTAESIDGHKKVHRGRLNDALSKLYLSEVSSIVDGPIRYIVSTVSDYVNIEKFEDFMLTIDMYVEWVGHMRYVLSEQRKILLQVVFGLLNINSSSDVMCLKKYEAVVSIVYDNEALTKLKTQSESLFMKQDGLDMGDLECAWKCLETDFRKKFPVWKEVDAEFARICKNLAHLKQNSSLDVWVKVEHSKDTLKIYYDHAFSYFSKEKSKDLLINFQLSNGVDEQNHITNVAHVDSIYCAKKVSEIACSSETLNSTLEDSGNQASYFEREKGNLLHPLDYNEPLKPATQEDKCGGSASEKNKCDRPAAETD